MRAVCKLWNDLLRSKAFAKTWKAQEKSLLFSQATYRKCGITPWAYCQFKCMRSSDTSDDAEVEEGEIEQWHGLKCGSDTSDGEEEEEGVIEQRLEVWHPASGARRKLSTAGGGLPDLHPPFCPCRKRQGHHHDRILFKNDSCFTVLASSEGLVCGHLKEEPAYVLAVGNPLTCTWKRLPSVLHPPVLPENSQLCALMSVDTSTSSYMVALFPRETRPPYAAGRYHPLTYEAKDEPFWLLIFHSKDDHWELACPFQWTSLPNSAPPYSGIPFLFPLPRPSRGSGKYCRIATFDMATRLWQAVAEAQLPKELSSWSYLGYRVFPYQGKCFLIAAGTRYNFLCCAAWVLDEQSKAFKLHSRMSRRLKDRWFEYYSTVLDGGTCDPYKLVTDGNLVIVSPVFDLEVWPIMAYDLELSMWTMMEETRPQFAYRRLCILSPSLSAAP